MSVRVRFAPSPTGYLHIGGARTALFNWLYARHCGATFVLRIEDTDAARNSQEAVDVILNGLRWLGLEWDEGPLTGAASGPSKGEFGPYFQSQRMAIYKKRVQELIDKGYAYEHEGAVKFRMDREPVMIPDVVVGNVRRELTDREQLHPDFVIVRSDGQPVFHLVNVIDDLEMKITHVIRGEDHLANTAKHLALFRAFGAEPPTYGHIPLILNIDGTKMGKRDVGASLQSYQDGGYAPEAVVNYLCLLGWSPKGNREILPLDEVVAMFDLPQILRHNARFDLAKLQWINWEYTKSMPIERFEVFAKEALAKVGVSTAEFSPEYCRAAFLTIKEKIKQFIYVPAFAAFYFRSEVVFDDSASASEATDYTALTRDCLVKLRDAFVSDTVFNSDSLAAVLKGVAAECAVKAGLLVHPLRLAMTGSAIGPSLYHLLEVLGKDRVLLRINQFVNRIEARL